MLYAHVQVKQYKLILSFFDEDWAFVHFLHASWALYAYGCKISAKKCTLLYNPVNFQLFLPFMVVSNLFYEQSKNTRAKNMLTVFLFYRVVRHFHKPQINESKYG